MSSPARSFDEVRLVREIKVLIEKGDKAADKAQQFYVSAGQHLKTLKGHATSAAAWEKLVKAKIGLGKSRAYELLAIADGRKTVEEIRSEKNKTSKIAHAKERSARSPLNSGETAAPPAAERLHGRVDEETQQIADRTEPRDDIGPASSGETERLRARVVELENEKRRLERENIALRAEVDELRATLAATSDRRPEAVAVTSAPTATTAPASGTTRPPDAPPADPRADPGEFPEWLKRPAPTNH